MSEFAECLINDRWPVVLPEHRRDFHAERPLWENGRLVSCAERIEPGMVVFDVGAEEGDFTALYRSWVGPDGDVVPVEPQPNYWPAIRRTWEANGFARPPLAWFPGFAGLETTVAAFGSALANLGWPDEAWPRCSEGPMRPDYGFRHLAQQADSTPTVRLDALADMAGRKPDVVVMDIEGAEWHALAGCEYLFTGPRPLFYVSVHEATMAEWYGTTLADLLVLASDYDYAGTELAANGEAETFWLLEPK